MYNTYGPTETTVSASLAELLPGQPVTIGTPLPNYGMLIRGEDGAVLPQGQVGELCITGPGVAGGYLGRPELTAEKFLANPRPRGEHDTRMYRSGDLARIDEQGQIQCLGRSDDQVKVRGFRVELGEIEAALYRQPGVGAAAVVLRDLAGIEQLVAFLAPEGEARPDPHALRAGLAQELPAYMIPARFELVAEVPRLTSGKIDRKALKARSWPRRPNPAARTTCPPPPASRRCSRRCVRCSPASRCAWRAISSVTWAAIRCWPRGWCPRCASIRIFRADHARAVPAFHAGGAGGAAGRAGGRAAVAGAGAARGRCPNARPSGGAGLAAWRSWRRCPS